MNLRFSTLLLVVCGCGWCAFGAPPSDSTEPSKDDSLQDAKREVESFWDTSSILEMAVDNLSQRYNLNEAQKAYTHDMMTTRVSAFIEKHRDEVWPLLRELVWQQRQGAPPDTEAAKRLGPRALKIIREAEEEIYRSNEEWRGILTEEQKRLHDWDLEEMDGTFELMKRNFEAWAKGNPESPQIFPARHKPPNEPRRPSKPDKPGTYHPSPKEDPELDVRFELYVEQFIKDYQLKPDQIEAAQSILREIKDRAATFRQTNAEQLREVKEKINVGKVAERRIWNERRKHLLKPITDLYGELVERLDQIPDDAQRERHQLRAQRGGPSAPAISSSRGKPATPAGVPNGEERETAGKPKPDRGAE